MSKLLTAAEVAKQLGVTPGCVTRYAREGIIQGVKEGKNYKFTSAAVKGFKQPAAPGRPRVRPEGGSVTVFLSHKDRDSINRKAKRAGVSASRFMAGVLAQAASSAFVDADGILAKLQNESS